ncbi:PAS domain S-box-containing protein [Prosthecobacter debontii]|uniref:PAS domain S-box-containing protein n=1 Tax=Prosthecobacter debontii TaxID=48467 RepID=A0A1T4XU54_9BACT|nr:AraC family transcriptional regulator [Prosthecobacter debontii]SKA92933.1 PAS domain S-box-containing protein [Prosthecobacter debontii]
MAPNSTQLRERFLRALAPESQFYRVLDHLPGISFFAKNSRFQIVCANQHFVESLGYKTELDLIGKEDFDIFPTRLAENFRRDDEQVLTTGEARLNLVELFFNPQGIPDWFITNKLPVRDRKGKVIGIMGTTQSYSHAAQTVHPYQQIEKALTYIRQHFRERITVEELAGMVHISTRQLHRKFVETFGVSPQTFIMKLRIQAACDALQHEDAQIGIVATEMGFCDQSSFTQHFHRHVGITPLKYQRQFRLVRKTGE